MGHFDPQNYKSGSLRSNPYFACLALIQLYVISAIKLYHAKHIYFKAPEWTNLTLKAVSGSSRSDPNFTSLALIQQYVISGRSYITQYSYTLNL